MSSMPLNLARSWRSKTFDEIIGQDLAIRMVKNSLYKNYLFPAYLLAGQRGCGKTTLGRVFAAAINCSQREQFTRDPHSVTLPCLSCDSCKAMSAGTHPDFNEIDAASHTGVDNVRALLEGASLLPGLATKKIYLIDEAHMLSKAAFNAFLKMLEEPPATVIFMLATTDAHKIIDTVRSRCFQIFLTPVVPSVMVSHLKRICEQEHIAYDESALSYIALESDGSVRDAINNIEQLRIAYDSVRYTDITHMTGDVSIEQLIDLCIMTFKGSLTDLIDRMRVLDFKRFNAFHIWRRMIEILKGIMWVCHGQCPDMLVIYQQALRDCASSISIELLVHCMDMWYKAEPLFAKTHAPHMLIELLFVHMFNAAHKNTTSTISNRNNVSITSQTPSVPEVAPLLEADSAQKRAHRNVITSENLISGDAVDPVWKTFLQAITTKQDPLVTSLFGQAIFEKYNNSEVHVRFEQPLFFKDLLDQTHSVWQPLLESIFGIGSMLKPRFETLPEKTPTEQAHDNNQVQQPSQHNVAISPASSLRCSATMADKRPAAPVASDLKNAEKWKKVHMVLRQFPGTLTEEKA